MASNYAKALGERVKKLLDGRSNSWLAEKIGRSDAHVSRMLHGHDGATISDIVGAAKALGLEPEGIFGAAPNLSHVPPEILEGLANYHPKRDTDWAPIAREIGVELKALTAKKTERKGG